MSANLQRELGTARKSAWLAACLLTSASVSRMGPLSQPVEADEISKGGKRENTRNAIREDLTGGGPLAETVVEGAKDREANDAAAEAVAATGSDTSQGFVRDRTGLRAATCTGDASACISPTFDPGPSEQPGRESVCDRAMTSRMGAFVGMRELGCIGSSPKTWPRHTQRYIREFKGRHDVRDSDSADLTAGAVAGMTGRGVLSDDPIRNESRASCARDVVA